MKKKILTLILICIICISSNFVMAYDDDVSDVLSGTGRVIGRITSMTGFYAATSLYDDADTTGKVTVFADIYTENANGEKVPVGYAQDKGKTHCSVDQTATSNLPPVGTYSVKKITVQHTIYDEENTIVYYIKRSESN